MNKQRCRIVINDRKMDDMGINYTSVGQGLVDFDDVLYAYSTSVEGLENEDITSINFKDGTNILLAEHIENIYYILGI